MADIIYEWLRNAGQSSYAPTSPPYMVDENFYAEPLTDETIPIDPSLISMMDPPLPPTSNQAIVTVPEHLAEATSKLLIYLLQTRDAPEGLKDSDGESIAKLTITTEDEMVTLMPIPEGSSETPLPDTINGVCVNTNPMGMEIKEVIDVERERIGTARRTFYLGRTINRNYYWFPARRTYRDRQLFKSIRSYRRKARKEATRQKTGDVKNLRNGKKFRT
jgi:hypothetical protein